MLADTRKPEHLRQLAELGIEPFDLVVSNLYPFRETAARGGAPDDGDRADRHRRTFDGSRGGEEPPVGRRRRLARAATPRCSTRCTTAGSRSSERKALAVDAFVHTASYDIAVASWLGNVYAPTDGGSGFPEWFGASWHRAEVLRYGENPHQRAALYRADHGARGLAQARVLHGKAMSYNNYVDTDAARRAAYDFTEPCVAIIKHANPCGIALGADIAEAHRKANACDPASAYGGVIATNRHVSLALAEQIADIFTEVVCAPGLRRRRARSVDHQEESAAARLRGHAPRPHRRDPTDQWRPADAKRRRHRIGRR